MQRVYRFSLNGICAYTGSPFFRQVLNPAASSKTCPSVPLNYYSFLVIILSDLQGAVRCPHARYSVDTNVSASLSLTSLFPPLARLHPLILALSYTSASRRGGGTLTTVNFERRRRTLLSPIISTLTGDAPVRAFRLNTYAYPGGWGYLRFLLSFLRFFTSRTPVAHLAQVQLASALPVLSSTRSGSTAIHCSAGEASCH